MLDLVITNVPDRVRVREVLSLKDSDVFKDHGTVSWISRLCKIYSQNKKNSVRLS